MRILLADDYRDCNETLRLILTGWGHDCTVAFDGATALQIAAERRPDLALLDIGLPDLDGWSVGKRLMELYENLPVFAVSGYGRDQDVAQSRAAGFAGHLLKPVDLASLQTLLSRFDARSAEDAH